MSDQTMHSAQEGTIGTDRGTQNISHKLNDQNASEENRDVKDASMSNATRTSGPKDANSGNQAGGGNGGNLKNP